MYKLQISRVFGVLGAFLNGLELKIHVERTHFYVANRFSSLPDHEAYLGESSGIGRTLSRTHVHSFWTARSRGVFAWPQGKSWRWTGWCRWSNCTSNHSLRQPVKNRNFSYLQAFWYNLWYFYFFFGGGDANKNGNYTKNYTTINYTNITR